MALWIHDPPEGILKDKYGKIRYEDIFDKELRKNTVECFNKCSKENCTVILACTLDSLHLWKEEFRNSGWNYWCTITTHPTKSFRGKINTNRLFEVL